MFIRVCVCLFACYVLFDLLFYVVCECYLKTYCDRFWLRLYDFVWIAFLCYECSWWMHMFQFQGFYVILANVA